MPPRKEPKEQVVYPSSKRKAPPFKPQRPSKVPAVSTKDSERSRHKRVPKVTSSKGIAKKAVQPLDDDHEDDDYDEGDDEEVGQQAGGLVTVESVRAGASISDSDEDLDDDPLAKLKKPAKSAAAAKKKPPVRSKTVQPISSDEDEPTRSSPPLAATDARPPPTQLSDSTQIPQALLIRLLHEHFADKKTKIDKHAIQIVQKYMEVFSREAMARTALQKKEAVEKGDVSASDAGWLELEDLEKVAGGMMLDF